MATLRDLTGQRFGRWTVLARADSRNSPSGLTRTYWLAKCECGESRDVLASMLTSGGSVSCGCLRGELAGQRSTARRRAHVNYYSAHRRVDHDRGRAKTHACIDCGEPAKEWSYDHKDQDEIRDAKGRPYSLKSDHYAPRCHSCHWSFDRKRPANA